MCCVSPQAPAAPQPRVPAHAAAPDPGGKCQQESLCSFQVEGGWAVTPLTQIAQRVSGVVFVVFFRRRRSTRHLDFLLLTCPSFAEVFLESLFHALQPALGRVCGSLLQVAAHPWCWHMIIAQEYSSLSWLFL